MNDDLVLFKQAIELNLRNIQNLEDTKILQKIIFAKDGLLSALLRQLSSMREIDRKNRGNAINKFKEDMNLFFNLKEEEDKQLSFIF
jgi:hypothetical protein